MSDAIFNLRLLKNYQVIDIPGTYTVTVSYTVTDKHLILDEYPRYLVPLKVITYKGLSELTDIIDDETIHIPFQQVSNLFMTGALWANDIDIENLPIKGEKVLASFNYVDNILRCVHIELLPRRELEYVNLDNLLLFRKTVNNLMNMKD